MSFFTTNDKSVSAELKRQTLKEKAKTLIESVIYEFVVNIISVANLIALATR